MIAFTSITDNNYVIRNSEFVHSEYDILEKTTYIESLVYHLRFIDIVAFSIFICEVFWTEMIRGVESICSSLKFLRHLQLIS